MRLSFILLLLSTALSNIHLLQAAQLFSWSPHDSCVTGSWTSKCAKLCSPENWHKKPRRGILSDYSVRQIVVHWVCLPPYVAPQTIFWWLYRSHWTFYVAFDNGPTSAFWFIHLFSDPEVIMLFWLFVAPAWRFLTARLTGLRYFATF